MTDDKPRFKIKLSAQASQNPSTQQEPQQFTIKVSSKPKVSIGQSRTAQLKAAATKRKRKSKVPQLPDSDEDETLNPVEEHVIFRLPQYDQRVIESLPKDSYAAQLIQACDKLRDLIKSRSTDIESQFKIEFKDARKALVTFTPQSKTTFKMVARLLDLPNIIEAQRSFDRRQFHKISDICQLLEVIQYDFARIGSSEVNVDEHIDKFFAPVTQLMTSLQLDQEYLHNSGILPPMKHSRTRRFRKRVDKRTLESVEREVARLLREDQKASQAEGIFIDSREVEERLNRDNDGENADAQTEDLNVVDEDESDGTASEMNKTMTEQTSDDEDSEEEGDAANQNNNEAVFEGVEGAVGADLDEDADIEDEPDEELRQLLQQFKILNEEMSELNIKIDQKVAQRNDCTNAILMKRFDDIVSRLREEVERKTLVLNGVERLIEEARQRISDEVKATNEGDIEDTEMEGQQTQQ